MKRRFGEKKERGQKSLIRDPKNNNQGAAKGLQRLDCTN